MPLARRAEPPMTVEAFRAWAAERPGRWELADGAPRAMAPVGSTHAFIQGRAAYLITRHLEATGSPCRVATEAPIVPSSFRRTNARAAAIAVTCAPPGEDDWALNDPVFLLEILSSTNERATRDNVWVYMSIPTVRQMLLVDSQAVHGEFLERSGNGAWPESPVVLGPEDIVTVQPIGLELRVADLYGATRLAV